MATVSFVAAIPAVTLTTIASEFGMSFATKGIFLSASFWGLAFAMLASGPLADRWGFRFILTLSGVLEFCGLLVISQANAPITAVAGGVLLGMGAGISDALLTPVVCALYPQRRTQMSNLLHAFYSIGLIVSIALMLGLMQLEVGWRAIYIVFSLIALPYGITMLMLSLPRPARENGTKLRLRAIVGKGAFLVFLAAIFLGGVTELGPSTWLPNYVEQLQGARAQGAIGLLVFGATMALGRLSASLVAKRMGVRRLFFIASLLCAVSLLMAALALSPPFTILWLGALAFGVAVFWPTILARAGDRFPTAGASMFSLLAAFGAFGGVVGPVVIGFIAESYDLGAAMATLAVAPLLILLLMLKR
jgi:MFS family permease